MAIGTFIRRRSSIALSAAFALLLLPASERGLSAECPRNVAASGCIGGVIESALDSIPQSSDRMDAAMGMSPRTYLRAHRSHRSGHGRRDRILAAHPPVAPVATSDNAIGPRVFASNRLRARGPQRANPMRC